MAKTRKISVILSINEGSGYEHELFIEPVELISFLWQETAKKIFESCGKYINCVVSPASNVYNHELGCPQGGDIAVKIEITANPSDNLDKWQEITISIIEQLQEDLKQPAVTVELSEIDIICL